VTSRLLAFVLAFIIGSPTCWCCLGGETKPVKTAARSCCHRENSDTGATDKPAQRQKCPCASSLIKRDLAEGKLVLPKPVLAHAEFIPAPAVDVLAPLVIVRAGLPLVDEDPPWREEKLYQRHCSRLL
jgi:hypothetical protein